ncbi:MAG: HNH endonuclease [Gemmatimonadetes bacterium]|nr:HNH endonuclease [Gemmatimonadota bacterium]MYE92011.1 HNH endonuclease [Gemmatimonadota bacterium]MYJ10564.1 HNH endonuclease [Gemmatimonadota bacterium]
MARNPPWTREELILALDLYLRRKNDPNPSSPLRAEVVELSETLNQLPLHRDRPDAARFRNPNAVNRKLGNFAHRDPDHPGVGLSRGNQLEEVVWKDFATDTKLLQQAVAAILSMATVEAPPEDPEQDDTGAREGALLFRWHRSRERNRRLVRRKLRSVLAKEGSLACEVCNFDFQRQYHGLQKPFIECHHLTPLAQLRPDSRVFLRDLALVCPNCHRMLHRQGDPSDLDALRARVTKSFSASESPA